VRELEAVPAKIQRVLDEEQTHIEQFSRWMADTQSVLFLGRHVGYPIALEGALKLKEISYIHAEGFAAGELKHGPIALIEPGQPVFVIVPSPRESAELHKKVVSNIQEIRARGARVIVVAEEGDAAVLPFADEVLRIPLAGRCSSRCSRSCRCTSSRWASRPRRASTSTSRATSRSPSPSSSPEHRAPRDASRRRSAPGRLARGSAGGPR
jgi:DNA-binding MurR/RpiR family transcriptional regulator